MQQLLANARLCEERAPEAAATGGQAPARQKFDEPLYDVNNEELEGVEEVSGEINAPLPDEEDGVVEGENDIEEEDWEAAAALTIAVRGVGEAAGLGDVARFFGQAGKVINCYRVDDTEVRVTFTEAAALPKAKALSGNKLGGSAVVVGLPQKPAAVQ